MWTGKISAVTLLAAPPVPGIDLAAATAIVTGGARGLGAACVRAFAAAGARVVIGDLLRAEGEALATEVGERACFVETDVTRQESADALVARALERFGAVDVLVNNAAVYQDLGRKRAFHEIPAEEWDRVMAVNVRGAWACTRAVYAAMRERRFGKVINVASSSVHLGASGFPHYVASKAAVIGLTHALARELGPDGICVNAVAPGIVSNVASAALNPSDYLAQAARSRAIPREMEPADLVGTIAFLAAPASNFLTGQTIVVDGGGVMT
jgi:NAD(P)-dependent dehydrogenase (short-subunit alcohol dehydrogenase family)